MTTEITWQFSMISIRILVASLIIKQFIWLLSSSRILEHFALDFIIILQEFWLEFLWPSLICCPTFKKKFQCCTTFFNFFLCCFHVVQHINFSIFFKFFEKNVVQHFIFIFIFDTTFEFQSGGGSEVCSFQKKCRWMMQMHNLLN